MKNIIEIVTADGCTVNTATLGPRNLITAAKTAHANGYSLRVSGFPVRAADTRDMANFHSEIDQHDPARAKHYAQWVRDRIISDLKDVDPANIQRQPFVIEWLPAGAYAACPCFRLVTEGMEIRHAFYTTCDRIGVRAHNRFIREADQHPEEIMVLGINFSHPMTWTEVLADFEARGWDLYHRGAYELMAA